MTQGRRHLPPPPPAPPPPPPPPPPPLPPRSRPASPCIAPGVLVQRLHVSFFFTLRAPLIPSLKLRDHEEGRGGHSVRSVSWHQTLLYTSATTPSHLILDVENRLHKRKLREDRCRRSVVVFSSNVVTQYCPSTEPRPCLARFPFWLSPRLILPVPPYLPGSLAQSSPHLPDQPS
ncbi:hypothetical protein LZ31DRAFT_11991 [Colletotrichum somersetense]|nr:hypothetical protein LZ31DRAFT_11991 [Colletotrichum somersetense]